MSKADRIVIRPANDADRDFVAGLVSSLLELGSPTWRDAEAFAAGFRKALIRTVADQDPRSCVLIAETEDGTPVGFVSRSVSNDLTGIERRHVADLAVEANARRIGVGTDLTCAAEAWARERGLPALSLDVWSTNERALTFYSHLGHRPGAAVPRKTARRASRNATAAGELDVRPLRTDERAWREHRLI